MPITTVIGPTNHRSAVQIGMVPEPDGLLPPDRGCSADEAVVSDALALGPADSNVAIIIGRLSSQVNRSTFGIGYTTK